MRYYIDTEFSERGPKYPIELISLGIVAQDGRLFYAMSNEFDADECNNWVRENVFPQLHLSPDVLAQAGNGNPHCGVPLRYLASLVREFIRKDPTPEFWAYFADYDWVVFCQIFGTMTDLPQGWPQYCNDIVQLNISLGVLDLPVQTTPVHNALNDARWCKEAHEFLLGVQEAKRR